MASPHTSSKKQRQCKFTELLNNSPPNGMNLMCILGSPVKKRNGPRTQGFGERQKSPRTIDELEALYDS